MANDIGLIGLAVMGQNLVLNMNDHGYSVSVFNRTRERTEEFIAGDAAGRDIIPSYELEDFVASLAKPRKIMLMVKEGAPVDGFIDSLIPLLEPGDLIIDGGNSFFKDTIRRNKNLTERGLLYIGTGVSGGEVGARFGPAIMPGGQAEAYALVEPIFTAISAKAGSSGDVPCCTYIGADGAGHYVKMVHNGIEYGDMELISEAYHLMRHGLDMPIDEIQKVFAQWNEGTLKSYLIEITADILTQIDQRTGKHLVEVILDSAGNKGTGKWTSQSALDLGVPAPTIVEAVFARYISAFKSERVNASQQLTGPTARFTSDKTAMIEAIRDALYASKIGSYAQGFALMTHAAKEYGWDLNFGAIARLWRGGCIIRAQFLDRITEAFEAQPGLPNLMLAPYFKDAILKAQDNWRKVVVAGVESGIPTPAFSSALAYFDSYRAETLPANIIQAQRDYFGAHTYKRLDIEGSYHVDWPEPGRPEIRTG
ncbi:MAG: NADP-dependent phosphogluconate dehydrogenase [Armatimonadetes bacterium]|nr:NADP-dependent phosphogluconate dehydrogenase [Armatimonadota bacterium]